MQVHASCQLDAPKEKCFDAFSDLKNLPNWVTAIKDIEILTEGSVGKGTRFKETRIMFGQESTEEMEVTLFEPNNHIREEVFASGLHYTTDWKFSETNSKTTVTVTLTIEAKTFPAKLMRLGFLLIKSSLKKAFLTDMEEMKKVIHAR